MEGLKWRLLALLPLLASVILFYMKTPQKCSLLDHNNFWISSKRIVTPKGVISGAVEVKGGNIVSVMEEDWHENVGTGQVIDYGEAVVMPGLIDWDMVSLFEFPPGLMIPFEPGGTGRTDPRSSSLCPNDQVHQKTCTRVQRGTESPPANPPMSKLEREVKCRAGLEIESLTFPSSTSAYILWHAYLDDPRRTEWEGFPSGTRAAAAGGLTTLVDMPLNSFPSTASEETFELKSFMCPSGINDFPMTNAGHIKYLSRHGIKTIWKSFGDFHEREPHLQIREARSCYLWFQLRWFTNCGGDWGAIVCCKMLEVFEKSTGKPPEELSLPLKRMLDSKTGEKIVEIFRSWWPHSTLFNLPNGNSIVLSHEDECPLHPRIVMVAFHFNGEWLEMGPWSVLMIQMSLQRLVKIAVLFFLQDVST
ncbi:unnamed protein product [Camellia sinensis]